MQKIGEMWKLGILNELFTLATKSPLTLGHTGTWYIFEHIYAPIREPTSSGMPDSWTFYDVGFKFSELADCYALQYSGNFWPEYFASAAEFRAAATAGESFILKKASAVLRMNIQKYMRLIELGGYTFNPLYNVDGEELFSSAEIHGDEIRTNQYDDTNTHTVNTYDDSPNEETVDHSTSAEDGDTITTSHVGTGQGVSADFNAFGDALDDSDLYHADRRIRRGNIGLTKSTELAQAFREDVRNNIIREYFDDLNEALLIPIY